MPKERVDDEHGVRRQEPPYEYQQSEVATQGSRIIGDFGHKRCSVTNSPELKPSACSPVVDVQPPRDVERQASIGEYFIRRDGMIGEQ